MTADLMVAAMLNAVLDLLEVDVRRSSAVDTILDRAERQLRLIALGMSEWRVVWEVVPDLAEQIIRENLEQLAASRRS